jgi:hypothetical protein
VAFAKLQNEITFIQEHDAFTDTTSGGTQDLSEGNDILDEVAEGPVPQDDATAAGVETQETEAAMDSAIERYLKTVRESIQNEIKQHMRPNCYTRGDFFYRKRHAVFALCDDSATGFNVDSLCARDVFVWLPLLLPSAPDFFKRTVPFKSVQQSRVTGPSKTPKCHVGHGNFCKVPKSFGDWAPNIENFCRLWRKTAENFRHVTASLGGCQNQNFVRRVTHHMGCRTDLNGTVHVVNVSLNTVRFPLIFKQMSYQRTLGYNDNPIARLV